MVNKRKIAGMLVIAGVAAGGFFGGLLASHYLEHHQQHSSQQSGGHISLGNGIYTIKEGNETYLIIKGNGSTTNLYITVNNNNNITISYKNINNNSINSIINNTSHKNVTPSNLEKIISEYATFGTNNSLVPLKVKNISQFSNNSVSMEAYNPYTGKYMYIILPTNENYIELTNGSNIPLQSIIKQLPSNQNLYLLLNIPNTNNISASGIYYMGNYNGNSMLALSENTRIAYFISPFNGTDISNVLTAAMNGKAKTLIITDNQVWNYSNAIWGWDNATSQSVIISSSPQLINNLKSYVNLSDKILGINTTNPGYEGILPAVIAQNYNITEHQGYKVYNINPNSSIYGILLVPAEGHQIIPKVINGLSPVPFIAAGAIASYNSGRKYNLSDSPISY